MVNITIYVEGGVLPSDDIAVQTADNSEKLRESFHILLAQIADETKFNLSVEVGSGEKQTISFFKSQLKKNFKTLLLIDLDAPERNKKEKLQMFDLTNEADKVIFMVQKMEAWILSQPEVIDRVLSERYKREKVDLAIGQDNNIFEKNPESITHPDRVLNTVFQRYFSELKRGVHKKKKYGKLKDAPLLIANLDTKRLKETFSDFARICIILGK